MRNSPCSPGRVRTTYGNGSVERNAAVGREGEMAYQLLMEREPLVKLWEEAWAEGVAA
ncbi:MAG: hypothetical protein XU14_C0020G0016 [Armatimonadetes bacterium CSP1-3]|nr:MAG: hypothetical protein XU14_C0020G0016 [Armatimonadetes bacterium CSP1-3]